SPAPRCARSPRRRCPTSTPTTSTWPSGSSPALPAPWASPSRTDTRNQVGGRRATPSANNHRRTRLMQHSKGYRKVAELVDKTKLYTPSEAIKLAKETNPVKFDATVEVAMRLGVDPRKADQMVRGTVNLPHGTGKTARVIVFAAGEKAAEAEAAGADVV